MEATVGHRLQRLAELPPQEVRVADEKHSLPFNDTSEDLRIVLTRPLVTACKKAVLEVILFHAFAGRLGMGRGGVGGSRVSQNDDLQDGRQLRSCHLLI